MWIVWMKKLEECFDILVYEIGNGEMIRELLV